MASSSVAVPQIQVNSNVLSHDQKQEQLLFSNILQYFTDHPHALTKVLTILKRKEGGKSTSLTLLDWVVTRFARSHFVQYTHPVTGEMHNVYEDYQLQLKAFSKKRSDPFCRSERYRLYIGPEKDDYIVTSTRQLNFFRFVIERGILDYVEANIEELHKLYVQEKRIPKDKHCDAESLPACEKLNVLEGKFEVSFN